MRITLYLFAVISLYTAFSQVEPSEIAKKIQDFHEVNPPEKLYIDFNKSSYVSGETIWMKTYLMSGFFNQLSPLSRVIYLELTDRDGAVIQEIKVESKSGIGVAQIDLNRDLQTGIYLLRGYTNWMRNFGKQYFYQKEIAIYNVFQSQDELVKLDTQIVKANFYPEGGNLVNSIQSRVAFQVFDQNGYPRQGEFTITDSNGNELGKVTSDNEGMGLFNLKPTSGESYWLNSGDSKFKLPAAAEKGQVLSLLNIPTFDNIRIQIQNNDSQVNNLTLVAHCRGLPTAATVLPLQNNVAGASISKENFPPGVNTITIFNESGVPLIERLFFIEPEESLKVNIQLKDSSLSKRELVELSITSMFADGAPAKSYLSLSATNDWEVDLDPNEDNIVSYMYLSGDLPGLINNPRKYINKNNDSRWKNQDLLMMIHGWTRFKWDEILNDTFNRTYPIEQGLYTTGRVEKALSSKPAKDATIVYTVQQEELTIGQVESGDEGQYAINDLYFHGEKYIVLDAKNKSGKNTVKLIPDTVITKPDYQQPVRSFLPEQNDEQQDDFIAKSLKRQQVDAAFDFEEDLVMLEGIEITGEAVKEEEKVNNIYGKGDYTLSTAEMASSSTYNHPLELLRNRVSGVQITGSGINWSVQIRGQGSINSSTTPIILLDNVEVSLDLLNSVPPNQIRSVEVYKGASAAIFGARGANGALAFFTKTGEGLSVINSYSEDIKVVKLDGYQEYKEFYSPDYSVKDERHVKPDYRSTVYWNPDLETTEDGETSASFYTTDEPMNITVIVEGMTQNGYPVYGVKKFKVR
ncbi:TonB-dependent receptor [Marinoscillum sp.]|uniref:TonB-dependent receptor n=1 Tax=Marinoscillum sp. TaxID=2024838 RepID=UPI003BAC92B3